MQECFALHNFYDGRNRVGLSEKTCVACRGGVEPLSMQEAKKLLKEIPEWEISSKGTSLVRNFKFKNFSKALEFVNKVGEIAEQEKHHPDLTFGWGYCQIVLTTHAIGGLHQNDFIVAAKINKLIPAV